jgi:peptide chain release factor subunit 1
VPDVAAQKVTRFYGCKLTTTNSAKQHKLQKIIACLSNQQAAGKEYISLYLPANTPIDANMVALRKDAEYIQTKTQTEKDRLQDTLKNIVKHLKQKQQIPTNGLAVFAGGYGCNQDSGEGFHVEELVPPQPISSYQAIFDYHFYLDPLRYMLRDQRVIGLIALDAKEASLGVAQGGNLTVSECLTSGIPGKTGKGGQSQRRYERERDMELTAFFHRIAKHAAKAFLENQKVTVLLVGGPGSTKNDFLKGGYLNYELQNKVLQVVDTQSADGVAVRMMFEASSDALSNMCGPEEKKTMERLLTSLNKQDGMAICGLDAVLEALKRGAVEVALTTDNPDLGELSLVCRNCGEPNTQIINKTDVATMRKFRSTPCQNCHMVDYEAVERDMVDVLEDAAAETNARVEVIFTESEEKAKLKALGGFAALLRYKNG